MQLSSADRVRLEDWWQQALARPRQLPDGLELVHSRLVRVVGRGDLPDAGPAFVKLMWFPRRKDRLRYACRALPAVHEAAMLEHCRRRGLAVPAVLLARGRRRLGLPRLSMLVTAGLPLLETPPSPEALVAAVRQLLAADLFHPDLHAGNFLPLLDGGVAVIDLQSARVRPGGLSARDRQAMLAKLLDCSTVPGETAELDRELGSALVAAEVCSAAELETAARAAVALGRRALVGRIRRCMRESSEFSVHPGLFGTLYQRRGTGRSVDPVEGGAELFRYWIGDRCLEILESRPPSCHGLYRRRWSRYHRLFVGPGRAEVSAELASELLRGHQRYQDLTQPQG